MVDDQPNHAVREEEVRLPALDGEIIQPDRWWQTATPGDIIRLCLAHNAAIARIQSLEQELAKGKVTWRALELASDSDICGIDDYLAAARKEVSDGK